MRRATVLAIVVVVALVAAGGFVALRALPSSSAGDANAAKAPTFTLTDIYGSPFVLQSYRNTSVVIIEFTALSCSECQIVEQSLTDLYHGYNATGTSDVRIVSIYIEPEFGDTIPKLQAYHTENDITWTMAQDTPSLAVSTSYSVGAIPAVFVIDPKGYIVYDVEGVQNEGTIRSTVSSAFAGTASTISLVTVSVFALAALAGVTTFFSPCAFPMFPGYMGLFLGLNSAQSANGGYSSAARRSVLAGSTTALGMMVVFLLIGVALILAANLVSGYVPDLLIVVAAILVALGGLLLTNLQYWRIVTPLQRLWARLRGASTDPATPTSVMPTAAAGGAFYLKLFGYGMGYAAAAAGCVAPVIFSAIVAGLALGLIGGIVNILIFSATAAILMIVTTVILGIAGRRYVAQLNALTPVIKKVSAVALIVVGVYLIWYYYTAWIV